jgi:uncharacterized protein (TIGR02246 family)
MSQTLTTRSAVLLAIVLGCAPHVDAARETTNLLERDRAWAALASSSKNVDSVLAFWTDDARVVTPGDSTVQGREAIRQMVARGYATPGFHVTWTPEVAVVSASGDLGYTRGTNEFTVPNGSGGTMKLPGRYLTVWRKGADGVWRCVEDYSTPMPASASKQ